MLLRRVLLAERRTGDEQTWFQRLKEHIHNRINPLLIRHQHSTITCEDVMRALPSSSHHLVEYEVVTIRHLTDKISFSFTATTAQEDNSTSPGLGELPESPVFLVGVLLSSATVSSYTGLLLGDATGTISCEVSLSCLPLDCLGRVLLPTRWSLIHSNISKCGGNYLEIQEARIVGEAGSLSSPHPCLQTAFSVTSLQDYFREKSREKSASLSVYGKVSSVSEVFPGGGRKGKDLVFLVNLSEEYDEGLFYTIFVQVPSLLHYSALLRVSGLYLFIALQEKCVSLGKDNKKTVLLVTGETEIVPYSPSDVTSQSSGSVTSLPSSADVPSGSASPPPHKKAKVSPRGQAPTSASADQLVNYQLT